MQQLRRRTIAAINMLPTSTVAPIPMFEFEGYETTTKHNNNGFTDFNKEHNSKTRNNLQ